MIKVSNIKLTLDENIEALKERCALKLGIKSSDINNFRILKESIDARKKSNIQLVYQVGFEGVNERKILQKANSSDVTVEEINSEFNIEAIAGREKLKNRPIIVGSGPAGLFAGLIMAKNGYNPIIFERGSSVDVRDKKIEDFFKKGILDEECNIQFGEGGAGTYSDGKLTTRIKDTACDYVLSEFIGAGAPQEIGYSFKPHIGTDILRNVVKNIREQIISLGGEVRFDSKVTDITIKNNKITSVRINDEYDLCCETVILALGHSARDTYEMLYRHGVAFEAKPFAIGVRIEHLQHMIDESQYGKSASHPKLRGANYKLAYTSKITGRPCYSFCMCPGGIVVAAASENNRLVVNGMSEYKRDKINANSAIVVGVGPSDFNSTHPLAGVEYQRSYEELAFKCGRGEYKAPVQLTGDFLKDKASTKVHGVVPSYTAGFEFGELKNCLPDYVVTTIKDGLLNFDNKIKGFASFDSVMTGIETRTSSPVRIIRGDTMQSLTVRGLYPAGEGAGYAGGIMSAAVDGIRVAESIINSYEAL